MGGPIDETTIDAPEALRAHIGAILPIAAGKVQTRLDHFARGFIALSPFLVLASMDEVGNAGASPRGDAAGFVQVLDATTLLIPHRRGNNRFESFGNVLGNPGVGLIVFVPGIDETLRVNGRATLVTSADLLGPLVARGMVPVTGLRVAVEEAFFHCAKALMRAKLWAPESRVERSTFPSLGRILAEQNGTVSVAEVERSTEEGYRTRLY